MRNLLVRPFVFVLFFSGLMISAQTPTKWEPVSEPGPWRIPLDEDSLASQVIIRILDAATGKGLPGAELKLIEEPTEALPDRMPVLASAKGDALGWIRLAVPSGVAKITDWSIVEAPGYAPKVAFGLIPEHPTLLTPGRDVSLLVRNPLKAPVPGVRIEYFQGCGHVPHLRVATTNDQGVAVLPNIDPADGEIWPVKPGYQSEYFDLHTALESDAPMEVQLRFSPTVSGMLREADGSPAAGLFVGSPNCHRGPWTVTDAQGRFALAGAGVGDTVYVRRRLNDRLPTLLLDRGEDDCRFAVTLPKPSEDYEIPTQSVLVTVRDAKGPLKGVPVAFVRASDGAQGAHRTGGGGQVTVSAPPGRGKWVVGSRIGFHKRRDVEGEVTSSTEEMNFELEPSPTFQLKVIEQSGQARTEDELHEKGPGNGKDAITDVRIVTASVALDVEEEARASGLVPRPSEPFQIAVQLFGKQWVLFPPPDSAAPLVSLDLTTAAKAALKTTPAPGRVMLRILDADGTVLEDVPVRITFQGRTVQRTTGEDGKLHAEPARIVYEDAFLHFGAMTETLAWTTKAGPNFPAEIRAPGGTIEVQAPPGRELMGATLFVDGIPIDGDSASWKVRWVDPGSYELILVADGVAPRRTKVTIAPNQTLLLAAPDI